MSDVVHPSNDAGVRTVSFEVENLDRIDPGLLSDSVGLAANGASDVSSMSKVIVILTVNE